MRIAVTPEAAAQLETRKRWWRQNRPATADLFDVEFLQAVALIAESSTLFPVVAEIGTRRVRRMLLERTACHLYFEIDETAVVVRILSAWGARQGTPPSL